MVTTDLFIHEHVFRVLQTIQLAKTNIYQGTCSSFELQSS